MTAEQATGACLIAGFWLPLGVCSWLAFTPSPPDAVFRMSDVLLHVFAFAYLTFALLLAHRLSAVRVLLLMLAYGAAIEALQSQIPERSAELKDLLVDGAGIAIGLAAGRLLGGWTRTTLGRILGAMLPSSR